MMGAQSLSLDLIGHGVMDESEAPPLLAVQPLHKNPGH